MLYGPAYKGIPLAAATAVANSHSSSSATFPMPSTARSQTDAEGGVIVGHALNGKVLIIDDVISAAPRCVNQWRSSAPLAPRRPGVAIAVDRRNAVAGTLSAVQEVEQEFGCGW